MEEKLFEIRIISESFFVPSEKKDPEERKILEKKKKEVLEKFSREISELFNNFNLEPENVKFLQSSCSPPSSCSCVSITAIITISLKKQDSNEERWKNYFTNETLLEKKISSNNI